jgi:hypothetical protein
MSENAPKPAEPEVGYHPIPETDLNDNGIPDAQEREDLSVDFGSGSHINSPSTRDQRMSKGMVAATHTPEGVSPTTDAIHAANAAASAEIDKNERLPHKTGFSNGDVAKRIDQIRKKRTPKSSFAKELSKVPQNKSDAETGLEIGKHTWKGIVQGIMSAKGDAEKKRDAALALELEELRQEQKKLDQAEKDAADAKKDVGNKGTEKAAEAGAEPGAGGNEGPDSTGGTGADGKGPEGKGPAGSAAQPDAKTAGASGVAAPSMDGGKVTGEAGLGLAAATLNPAAGVAIAAVQANETQKSAGMSHDPKKPTAKNDNKVETAADVASKMNVRTLGVAPNPAAAQPGFDRLAHPAPGNNSKQQGGALFAQARALPRPAAPTIAMGPSSPAPRVRVQGLGAGIGGFMKAARVLTGSSDKELSVNAWMQKQRDSEGLSR